MTRASIARLVPWVAALALTAAGCTAQGSAEPRPSVEGPAVAVRDYEFEPAMTWVWEGRAPHNVVGQGFESNDQSSGTFRHTFDEPGTYPYECTIHPGMEATIVVEGDTP